MQGNALVHADEPIPVNCSIPAAPEVPRGARRIFWRLLFGVGIALAMGASVSGDTPDDGIRFRWREG